MAAAATVTGDEPKKRSSWTIILLLLNILFIAYLVLPSDLFTEDDDEEEEQEERENPNKYNPYANCLCERKYQPVCGKIPTSKDGSSFMEVTIGNECEAKCQLIESFSPGECPNQAKSHIARARCQYENCPALTKETLKPVCWVGENKYMACFVECEVKHEYPDIKDFDAAKDIQEGECKNPCLDDPCADTMGLECLAPFGKCQPQFAPCPEHYCVTKDEDCTCDENDWSPVCSKGQTFTNLCFAKCMALGEGAESGVCPKGKRDPYFPLPYPIGPINHPHFDRYELHVHEL